MCIQAALLYTNALGERRIRVHSISVPVTTAIANVFRHADLDAIVNLSLKQAVSQIYNRSTPEQAQKALTQACMDSMFIYRKFCAASTSAGQLILPEPLKLLPLCTVGLIKHPIFQAGLSADERMFLHSYCTSLPTNVACPFVAPRLFNISDIPESCCVPDENDRVFLPQPLTLSAESMQPNDMYLMENGRFIYLWISDHVSDEEIYAVFGDSVEDDQLEILEDEEITSQASRILCLIDEIRRNSAIFKSLQIINMKNSHNRQLGSIEESLDETTFFSQLIEDRPAKAPKPAKGKTKNPAHMSYVDFLCWLHKKIQDKFYA